MKEDRQDLTTGSIWGKMLFFSIPLVLTNFLQVLFNMADIAVIGQFAGSLSLGAVGSTTTYEEAFVLSGCSWYCKYSIESVFCNCL